LEWPYDHGNAGDLIKHEWLLRALDWIPAGSNYLDAFAGMPEAPLVAAVESRIQAAPNELRLRVAQTEFHRRRYLGSLELARRHHNHPQVRWFDKEKDVIFSIGERHTPYNYLPNYVHIEDGYRAITINHLRTSMQLVLIDPFNLLKDIQSNLWDDLTAFNNAVLVFILNENPRVGRRVHPPAVRCRDIG